MLADGLINLKIEPEVSQLDTSNPVQVAGISVPPLIVRRASTTVELRDGQSFVIGGLLQSQGETAQQQLPWLGDVPILGALFRSAAYKKKETDLAIIVGPEGGLTEREAAEAGAAGVRSVSLGPRILRAETAGVVAASAILFAAGDLGGV